MNRRSLRPVVALAISALALALAAAPASAKVVYPFQESLTGAATPAGSFTPLGLAVDPSSHDLYVSDSAHKVIDNLSSAGSYLCQITGSGSASASASECDKGVAGPGAFASASGQGIVGAAGTLFFPDTSAHAIERFSAAGAFVSPKLAVPGAGNPAQVALDASGNLYVADPKNHIVDKYTTATEAWSTFATGTRTYNFNFPAPTGVAVDTDPSSPAFGDVYVVDTTNLGSGQVHAVDVFAANGTYLSQITATPAGPLSTSLGKLAVDPTDGHLFVPDTGNGTVDEFAPGGAFISRIPVPSVPAPSSPQAVAIDPTTGTLYVADKANEVVDVFASAVVPTVTTGSATGVEETGAALNGEVDPAGGGEATECDFQYVEAAAYEPAAANPYAGGANVPCSPAPPYAVPAQVSAEVSLVPHATYHYRLLAANGNGVKSFGEDRTLTTSGAPRVEAGSENSLVSGVDATLKAKVDPSGLDTSCQVQYLTEAAFQAGGWAAAATILCSPADLGSGSGLRAAAATLEGLAIDTAYRYRFVVANSAVGGTTTGEEKTFLTFGVQSLEFQLIDSEGHPYTEAGGHPYELETSFALNLTENAEGEPFPTSNKHPRELPTGNLRTAVTELPPGVIGNPSATPRCTRADVIRFACSPAAQVGLLDLEEAAGSPDIAGLYNLAPPKGVVAEFGANILQHVVVYIDARLHPDGGYTITAEAENNSTATGVDEVFLDLWGVPADPRHDHERCPQPVGSRETGYFCVQGSQASGTSEIPLLSDPTSCGGPLTTTFAFDSYQASGLFDVHSVSTPPITGCNALDFNPSLEARPTTDLSDSPSGLKVDLHIPQRPAIEDPAARREADLKDTTVTLPEGITVNPAAAGGLEACSASQIGLISTPGAPIRFNGSPAQCPDASKIGTVEVLSPLLSEHDLAGNATGAHPLPGAVYIARPNDNPFDSLLAIYVAVEDPETGVIVKLAGHVVADQATGQLTTSFEESPQVPFEDFKLDFFKGPHATLRTPPTCGTYRTTSSLTPWSAPETGPPATPADTYQISQAPGGGSCPGAPGQEPNAPSFEAGTESPAAGAYSPFVLHLSRADGSQELKAIETTLPPGLTGKLAGIPYCPEAGIARAQSRSNAEEGKLEQADPSCPAASQVGTVTVGAGSGPSPFYVTGHAYWAGPYKGAPLSMVIVTPAVAGPFDLGVVVVRVALQVDPETARIHAVSDPLPTILDGIPLDVRSIVLKLSRPDFTLNPTSCEKMAVTGSALSAQGKVAPLTSPFQVGGCKGLAFKPHLKIQLQGQTRRIGHPALKATLTARPGQANIARAQVNLPGSEFLDQGNLNKTCTKPVLLAGACPANTVYGTAKAWTPLLEKPLEGPVYLVGGYGYKLPALVAELNGQIRVLLVGKVDSGKNKGIRNTFEVVPDAPVEKFVLEMKGGPKYGLLENSVPLCEKPQKAIAEFTGQNGVVEVQHPQLITDCGKGHKGKKHHKAKKAGGKHHHPGH